VSLTNIEPPAASGSDHQKGHSDRVAWVIAIVGVLIAAAQLAHDAFGFLK
jgi:hypothetical protein